MSRYEIYYDSDSGSNLYEVEYVDSFILEESSLKFYNDQKELIAMFVNWSGFKLISKKNR